MITIVFIYYGNTTNINYYIDNIINKITLDYKIIFVCNKLNKKFVNEHIANQNLEIKLLNYSSYNETCLDIDFWNMFETDKLLIHNMKYEITDENLNEWMKKDFIGMKRKKVIKKCSIDGGLSIRNRLKMIEVLEKEEIEPGWAEDLFFNKYINKDEQIQINDSIIKCINTNTKKNEELNYTHIYPNLFHKYILGLRKPDANMVYELKQRYDIKKELVAHLHCFNIDEFNNYYGYRINEIVKHYFTVVTYSKGEYKIGSIKNATVIKHENRGADVGGKFIINKYLNDIEYDYKFILSLHSKSNINKRKMYYEPFIDNIEQTIQQLDENYGLYVPQYILNNKNTVLYKERKLNFTKIEDNWGLNSIYTNELLKYLCLDNCNHIFSEGNVFICNKEIHNHMYNNPILWNILNTFDSYDYSWFIHYYKKQSTVRDAYLLCREKKLYNNNFETKKGWKGLADCMIEHAFERIVFSTTKYFNKKIKILYSNQDFKLNKFIESGNKDNLTCLIACHTSNDIKYDAIIHNLPYYTDICDAIYIINSNEYKGEIEKRIDKSKYIINNELSDQDIADYKKNNRDLGRLSNNELIGHWERHGKEEKRKINDKLFINIVYDENTHLLCQGKWYNAIKKYKLEGNFILTNDSIFIVNSMDKFNSTIQKDYDMVTIFESYEQKPHYTDMLRYYSRIGITKLLKHYEDNFSKIKKTKHMDYKLVIHFLEIGSTNIVSNKTSVYKSPENYRKNIHFDDRMNKLMLEDKNYPIVKIKKINIIQYNNQVPKDFDPNIYKLIHNDLKTMSDRDSHKHFINYGMKEGRKYKSKQKIILPDYLQKYDVLTNLFL